MAPRCQNIRGLARCYRRLGKNKQAMDHYDRLIDGLPEKSAVWWRAQLERLEFFLEVYADNAEGVRDVLLHIRQLRRYFGGGLGGFHKQFGVIEGKAGELLKAASPTGMSAGKTGGPLPAGLWRRGNVGFEVPGRRTYTRRQSGGIAKWTKATDCKSVIRGFESHCRL